LVLVVLAVLVFHEDLMEEIPLLSHSPQMVEEVVDVTLIVVEDLVDLVVVVLGQMLLHPLQLEQQEALQMVFLHLLVGEILVVLTQELQPTPKVEVVEVVLVLLVVLGMLLVLVALEVVDSHSLFLGLL
tara:strand:+ start:361 stop:747 length:387 start_codon:yes stop_codon:yes gene_type:complete